MIRRWLLLVIVALLPISFALDVKAAISMIIDVQPKNPGPNQEITVTVSSYNFDLNRALISWRVNGAPVSNGIGQKTFRVTTGNLGSATTIEINAGGANGSTVKGLVTVRPADLKLAWQADTDVPFWYRGKALAGPGAEISVIADPDFVDSRGPIIDRDLI